MIKALLISFIVGANAICGTSCGGCTAPCANNPAYTCTDCGTEPCVDVNLECWSCAGSDGNCYPYDCGTTCSTAPCSSVEALANSVPKKTAKDATFIDGKKKSAPAMVQKAAPTTRVGTMTSKAAVEVATDLAPVKMRKKAVKASNKVFDRNQIEIISKDTDHMCTRFVGQKNATHPNTCNYYGGCSDCSTWAAGQGYGYSCCYDTYCCAYAVSGPCSADVNCPSNDCA